MESDDGQLVVLVAALSPVLIVAALDGNFGRWMPLRANPDVDCLAPVEVQ